MTDEEKKVWNGLLTRIREDRTFEILGSDEDAALLAVDAAWKRLEKVKLWVENEGITLDDVALLEESEKRLHGAVEWACVEMVKSGLGTSYLYAELRRRAKEGKG